PCIGMLLLPTVGFDFIIWLATILSIATAIACFWFPVKNIPLTEEHKAQLKKWSVKSFVEPKVFFISGIAFLIGLAYSSVLGFLSIYASDL
ncbi:MFS transporter, partial [Enterococcus faecalis]|nr:MFS transporter [Enterococcus faecalis]